MPFPSSQEALNEIRKAGLRATASRLAVLELVRQAKRPVTHAAIVTLLESEPWNRATLYRNLNDLAEVGLLRRVQLGAAWHFEAGLENSENQGHPHFVCDECGTVQCTPEVQMQLCTSEQSSKAIRQGQVDIELHGRCDACQ